MAKVSNREDALFNAYLSKYKNAQASTVSEGQSKTQAARQKGAAILNATDKTLPSLGDTYGSTLQNIVSGAKMENSLSSDLLNRNLSLAKAQYDYASDMHTQMTAAKKYADEQAEKARKEAEEAAAKAQKEAERQAAAAAKAAAKASRRSSGRRKGSGKKSSSSTASSEDAAAALDALDEETAATTTSGKGTAKAGGNYNANRSNAERNASARARYDGSKQEKADIKYRAQQKAAATQKALVEKQTAANAGANKGKAVGKHYAEQQNAGNTTQKPMASQAATRAGQPVASSYAASGQDSSPEVKSAAKKNRADYKSVQEDTAAALKKLQTDAGYRAELAAPGRKLTTAEIKAVKQYDQNAGDLFKQVQNGTLSLDDYNTQAQALSRINQKASLNGLGQDLQAATAGFMRSFPLQKQTEQAFTDWADKQTGGKYTQAVENGTIPAIVPTLDKYTEQDPLAAMAGTMAGKAVQYNAFNQLMDGTKYANAAQKAGGKLYDAAKNIPVLKDIVQPGFGEAAGRVLADTGADLALDTLPTLADDLSTYRDQQQAIANGDTVNDTLTPGKIAGNTAKNIAGNVAMNALPEIGGAVISGIKNRRAADKMLEQQAKELDEWKNMTSGLYNADDYAAPDEPIDFTAAIQNSLDDTARQQRNAAAATRAEQLNTALAEQAAEDKAAYAARQAAQNSGNLPIDAQGAASYNKTNGGVVDADMGAGVRADVLRDAERGAGIEYEPGSAGTGLFGQDGTAGQSGAARGNGYGVQGDGAKDPAAVAEWAKSITGKDRKSSYTRRIENLYNQMQNGASRESMADEATSIAMGIVKDGDFAEPLDEATTTLREYFKNTPIRLDEQAAGDILYSSGLRNIQQYNIQNGTNFSLTNGVPYDTAMMELSDMGAGVSGSSVDDLLQVVSDSNRKPILDTDLAAAHVDYYRDAILNGTDVRSTDFDTWLRGQPNDETTPDYIRNLMKRPDFKEPPVDYDLLSLEDNYQQLEPAPQADGSELNGLFLNENAPLTSDTGYSYAADHLQDAMNRNSSGSVAQDSPYYNDWMQNQGALRQQQAAGGLLADDADAMEAAANRMDSLNRRSEELLGQDALYRQQQEKAAARQARLDAIRQEYERAANQVPTLEPLAGSTADWQTQPGLMLENGEGLNAYTAPAARQTAESVQTAAPQARPLNGSESVPANAVGAESTQFDRREVVNQDYANQRGMTSGLDEEHLKDLKTENTHQVWTDAEAKKQAEDDISTYIQQAGGDENKALDAAMQDLKNKEHWNKGDSATADEIRDRLKNQFAATEPGTPEYYTQKARYEAWNQKRSQVRRETAQTMQSFHGDASERANAAAKPITERWVKNNPAQDEKIKSLSDELTKLKDELRERDIADMEREAMQGVFENGSNAAKRPAGDMNAEFDQMLKDAGVITDAVKTDTTAEFDALAKRVKELCEKHKVNCSDDAAKDIAGRILNGDNAEQYYNKLIMQAAGISDLTLDEMERVDTLYSEAATLGDSKERYALEQEAINIMAKHLPAKSWFERFDNIRYLAMLGNPTTHARNLIGNVLMGGIASAKDEVAAAMQLVLPQEARTKALYTPREMVDAAGKYIDENAYQAVLKDGGRYDLAQGLTRAQKTYGDNAFGRAVQWMSDKNSDLLDKEDEIFLKAGAMRSLASNLTAKGYDASIFSRTDDEAKAIIGNALEQAIQDGKDITFHADNALTKALGKISHLGDKNGSIGDKIAYCIGNGLLPFSKTPGNILKTSLEYTPVGGVAQAVWRGATHKGAAAVTDSLAKGVVGTALMGLGWWLADSGFVTGSLGDNKDYQTMLGKQEFSLNIPGKGSYSIDWAAPSVVPVMMGATMSAQNIDLSDLMENPEKYAGQVGDILANALDPVTQMSLLQSANNTFESIRYNNDDAFGAAGSIVGNTLTNYAQQFVPTVLSKAARTLDDTRRSTYGGGDTQSERNTSYLTRSLQNKIPVLSQQNEPYIDQWGREEASLDGTDDTAGGMFLRGVYNFASPGYYSAENVTPVDEYLQGLYGDTNNSKVYPEKASSKITVDGEGYYMTPEEKTEYAKTSGQTAYDIVDSLRQNSMFLQLPEDQQAELVQNAYSVAKTVGGVASVGDGVSGTEEKEYEAYQNGGTEGVVNYMLAKNAVDVALDDVKASTGDEDASLADVEKWNAIHGEMGNDGIEQFVSMTSKDSLVRRVDNAAGSNAAAAYMNAYSKASTGLEDGQTPSSYDVGLSMMKQGLSDADLAKAYVAAYSKKDKNGASIYQTYGANALTDWIRYKSAADLDGNGKVSKSEATATLNQMDLTNELRRAYLAATNKRWSNPY